MDDRHFEAALALVLRHEGGYVNDKADKGGETKFGISKRSYPHLNIRNLTTQDAARIYKSDYWDRGRFALLDNRDLAVRVFDLAVNCGVSTAVQLLQKAYNLLAGPSLFALTVDGQLGPKTAAAINRHQYPKALLAALKYQAAQRYINLGQPKYLTGWFKRLED